MLRQTMPAVALAAAISAWGQTAAPADVHVEKLIDNTKVLYFDGSEAADTAYRTQLLQFYEDQFRHIRDPRAPYLMLLSRDGALGMGIGGKLEMLGFYDWNGSLSSTDFVPYNIPMTPDPTSKNFLQTTAGKSALFFTVFGNSRKVGNYRMYIEGKFSGPGNAFKLSKAYATIGDWTVGYTKSTFSDPTAEPATLETQGPNAEVGKTRLLVRYMHSLKKGFSYAVSLETPNNDIPKSSITAPLENYAPDVAAFVQYQKGREHLRLAAIMTPMGYRDINAGTNHRVLGWGVNLSTLYRPVGALTVYGAFNTGQGIADLSTGGDALVALADSPGRMYAPWSFGWYGALQYNYTPDIFSTVILSQRRMLPKKDAAYGGDDFRYGLYGTANVFWNITSRMQVGAEINIGSRCNMDGAKRWAYRAGLLAEFSF